MLDMRDLCESCKFAIIEGGDYCDGFGGCYTPTFVSECTHEKVQAKKDYKDMDFDNITECEYYQEDTRKFDYFPEGEK